MSKFLKNHPNLNGEKQKLHRLHGRQKIQYIWDYYKLPIFICLIFIYILGYIAYGYLTHKETILSVALINVASEEHLTTMLSEEFLKENHINTDKNEVSLYTGLYLTADDTNDNYQYAYATNIKLLGMIDAQELDVVLMNEEAFDIFSERGYLYELENLLKEKDKEQYEKLSPYLKSAGKSTDNAKLALELSHAPLIQEMDFNGEIYFGIIANTTHLDNCVDYINYLFHDSSSPSPQN